MIAIVSNDDLGYAFAFGEHHNETREALLELFLTRYGQEVYSKSKVIIISDENFFHVIKNAYHLPVLYELKEELQDYILRYTALWKTNTFKESIMSTRGF